MMKRFIRDSIFLPTSFKSFHFMFSFTVWYTDITVNMSLFRPTNSIIQWQQQTNSQITLHIFHSKCCSNQFKRKIHFQTNTFIFISFKMYLIWFVVSKIASFYCYCRCCCCWYFSEHSTGKQSIGFSSSIIWMSTKAYVTLDRVESLMRF